MDHYVCERCQNKIPLAEKQEHEDWHYAKQLQDGDPDFAQPTSSTSNAPTYAPPPGPPPPSQSSAPVYAPPPGPPPSRSADVKHHPDEKHAAPSSDFKGGGASPSYAPPPGPPPTSKHPTGGPSKDSNAPAPVYQRPPGHQHTNKVIQAAARRAVDEQEMQIMLQNLQYQYRIYNSDIEPEHDTDFYCNCPIHQYMMRKRNRSGVMRAWSEAVMYPGEKHYENVFQPQGGLFFSSNPYTNRVMSPYGYNNYSSMYGGVKSPQPEWHARSIHQTIQLNAALNREAQDDINRKEPQINIWEDIDTHLNRLNLGDNKQAPEHGGDEKRKSVAAPNGDTNGKSSKFSLRKAIGIKSSEERQVHKTEKAFEKTSKLRSEILAEEIGRWPTSEDRHIVAVYQEKVGMAGKIAHLRNTQPIQYLHLLRAGYFEPIPVAWADQASNPLKFSIEAASGYRGITPAWRGYEDTAEERLYWVLNHREGSVGMRMKPDFISEMNMARDRMSKAVEPPPQYFAANDTCHQQHTSEGYSKQVMPATFRAYDRPEMATDDTMLLVDVSGSMGFDPMRPTYTQYMITSYHPSTQPKNKDVAKAIIRRFTDAMSNHDHQFRGYDLTTFSSKAEFIGTINHRNLDEMWRKVKIGGGTRVMTGWQKVKERHFQKHSESATHHPVFGWQAGPETPMLRLLLLLDGEATDMDEFELDLLGLSWAHVTIFLIGVDGCPHHHRHANELQRISDVNHHVSFVDAQGNTPERFVTHELLKRHLGYDMQMEEFERIEELPAYTEREV